MEWIFSFFSWDIQQNKLNMWLNLVWKIAVSIRWVWSVSPILYSQWRYLKSKCAQMIKIIVEGLHNPLDLAFDPIRLDPAWGHVNIGIYTKLATKLPPPKWLILNLFSYFIDHTKFNQLNSIFFISYKNYLCFNLLTYHNFILNYNIKTKCYSFVGTGTWASGEMFILL